MTDHVTLPREVVEKDTQFEVWQDDMLVAGSDSLSEAQHYAAVYGQDGPVEIKVAVTTRVPLEQWPQSLASAPQVGGELRERIIQHVTKAVFLGFEHGQCEPDWEPLYIRNDVAGPATDAILAALSQEAEPVAWQWRYKDAEQWQFVHHRHALDLSRDPRCVVRRLIVHPSDRGGEVKG